MKYDVGLDVSVKLTAICIVDEAGTVVRETVLVTEPSSLASYLEGTGLRFERIGLEAGPMSSWLHDGLLAAGFPVIVVEARHMKSALSAMRNKGLRCSRGSATATIWASGRRLPKPGMMPKRAFTMEWRIDSALPP